MPPKGHKIAKYGLEDREAAFIAVALEGTCDKAHELLKAQGRTVSARTIQRWIKDEAARYEQVREDLQGRVSGRLAIAAEDTAIAAIEATQEGIALTRQQIQSGDIKDAGSAVRNLTTAAGIMIDKANLLRGKPTSIIEQRSADEIIQSLERLAGITDIPDADIVEEPDITT